MGRVSHAVYVAMYPDLDWRFLDIATQCRPDIHFHVIGPFPSRLSRKNLTLYGPMSFEDTLPYIVYVDLGLDILDPKSLGSKAALFKNSLKIKQYTYSKLAIVGHRQLDLDIPHGFHYDIDQNRESIKKALNDALAFDKNKIDRSKINSWESLMNVLIACV